MENLPSIVTAMDESDCPQAKKPKETALDILLALEDDPDQETTSFSDELQGYEASKIPIYLSGGRLTCIIIPTLLK